MKFSLTFIVLILSFSLYGKLAKDSTKPNIKSFVNATYINADYHFSMPFSDFKNRYGASNLIGIGIGHKFNRNYVVGGSVSYLFGGKVKESSILDSLIGSSGELINNQGNLATLRMYLRGWSYQFYIGKLFYLNPKKVNSGIILKAGIGFLQHKIKFQFTPTTLPQIDGDYMKGYDRLSNGIMYKQFIGYTHFDQEGMFSYYIGVESLIAKTKNRREINFDTRVKDNKVYTDILIGPKIGLMIVFNGRVATGKKGEDNRFFD